MVTYSGLFQFCILIVAIINLIVMIFFNHKKTLGKPSTVLLSVFILYDTGFKKSMGLMSHFFM